MDMTLGIAVALTLLLAVACYKDATRYIIPNWVCLAVLALFPLYALTAPSAPDWQSALLAFGVVFAGGFIIFLLRLMGAGDIKLMMALAPWCGFTKALLTLLIYTAVLGGALAVIVYIARLWLPAAMVRCGKEGNIPRLLTHGEPIPYGLAIVAAFLYMLWSGQLPLLAMPA